MMRSVRFLPAVVLAGLLATFVVSGPVPAAEKDPEAARQARIEKYLRNKEEKRLERERKRAEKEAAAQAQAEEQARIAVEQEALAAQQRADEEAAKAQKALENEQQVVATGRRLPKSLAVAQENVRRSGLGQDPTVLAYLDLVDQQAASPYQLAALGNFLAEAGMREEALAYYQVAVDLERNDSLLWTNLGTLHRQLGDAKAAAGAYSRALSIDRNNAVAHYNLGAAYDSLGKYDAAIEEFKIALILDPALGDPAVNPQAANNERLMSVKLLVYKQQIGSAGLPLSKVPGGELPPPPAEE